MCDELKLINIDKNISYIASTENPLSSNVVIIRGKYDFWLYDVGNHQDISDMLDSVIPKGRGVNVVLSHFHEDHIGNLSRIRNDKVYQGKTTYRHTGVGEIVENDIFFDDSEVKLHIFPIPSSHAKGSIAMEVNEEYCFLGDSVYAMYKGSQRLYNAGVLQEQIKVLKGVKAANFMLSHRTPFAKPKNTVIMWLEEIYGRRDKNEAYIRV